MAYQDNYVRGLYLYVKGKCDTTRNVNSKSWLRWLYLYYKTISSFDGTLVFPIFSWWSAERCDFEMPQRFERRPFLVLDGFWNNKILSTSSLTIPGKWIENVWCFRDQFFTWRGREGESKCGDSLYRSDYSGKCPTYKCKCEEICFLFALRILFELLLDARGKSKWYKVTNSEALRYASSIVSFCMIFYWQG